MMGTERIPLGPETNWGDEIWFLILRIDFVRPGGLAEAGCCFLRAIVAIVAWLRTSRMRRDWVEAGFRRGIERGTRGGLASSSTGSPREEVRGSGSREVSRANGSSRCCSSRSGSAS